MAAAGPISAPSPSLRIASFVRRACGADRDWNSRCFPPERFFGSRAGRTATRGSQRCILAVLNSQLLLVGSFRQLLPFKRSQIGVLSQGALLPWHCAFLFALRRCA